MIGEEFWWVWEEQKKEEGGCVLFGVVLSLGICPKFTPAPHISASAGVMREGESERHSWA